MDQIGRDPDGSGIMRGRDPDGFRIRQGEIQMDQAKGGFCELLEFDWRRVGGDRSSEYEEKPKRAKI